MDTERETFGAGTHDFALGERASDQAIKRAEKLAGATFPEEYRQFVKHVGTRAGPDYGLLPIDARPPCAHEDGIRLTDMGCGYFSFLGVRGERAGQVWLDYTAGDGEVIQSADSFLAWYERWLDDSLRAAIASHARKSMDGRSPHHERMKEHRGLFDSHAVELRSFAAADRAIVASYFGDDEAARKAMLESVAALGEHAFVQAAADIVFRRELASAAKEKGAALAELSKHPYAKVRRVALGNPALDANAVRAVTERAREAMRMREGDPDGFLELDLVARAEKTSPELLAELARAESGLTSWVARGVACNEAIADALLDTLARHPAPWVRHAVGFHPRARTTALELLANDAHAFVRAAVASNPRTDAALLTKLALDDHPQVLRSVAGNPSTPANVLVMLLVDRRLDGLYELCKNHGRLSPDARALLEMHPQFYASYLEPPSSSSGSTNGDLPPTAPAFDVLRSTRNTFHPSYPTALFDALLTSADDLVTYGMAAHPFIDATLLEKIAAHKYGYTRLRVANHPSTPIEVVLRMVDGDTWEDVTAGCVDHPLFPPARLEALVTHASDRVRESVAKHPKLDARSLEVLAGDPVAYVRRGAAMNPSIPPSLVEKLAADSSEQARWAIAWNAATPASVLEKLAGDPDPRTQKTVKWRLAEAKLRLTMVNA